MKANKIKTLVLAGALLLKELQRREGDVEGSFNQQPTNRRCTMMKSITATIAAVAMLMILTTVPQARADDIRDLDAVEALKNKLQAENVYLVANRDSEMVII